MILKKNIYLIRLLALKQAIHNPVYVHMGIKQTRFSKLLIVFICTQQDYKRLYFLSRYMLNVPQCHCYCI